MKRYLLLLVWVQIVLLSGCYNRDNDVRARVEKHYAAQPLTGVKITGSPIVCKITEAPDNKFIVAYGYYDAIQLPGTVGNNPEQRTKMYFRAKFEKIQPKGFMENKFSQIVMDIPESSSIVQTFWNNDEDVFMRFVYGPS